MTTANIAYEIK